MKHAKGEIRNTEQAAALGCACRAHDSARRGIILLFVLGLLALFSLVAVTFVVVARIHKRSTHFAAQIERTGDSPDQLLRQAALQVVRGTNNPRSVLRPHSLLEDLYGSDGLEGEVITVPQVVMPQLVQFQISATSSSPTPLAQVDNYYTGRVLTVRTGNSAGRSWRVVKSTSAGEITVFAEGVTASGINERGQVAIKAEDRILINGAPFNGTGFGFNMDRASAFDPTSQVLLDRLDQSGYPYALLPNSAHFTATTDYLDPAGPGGADEEYDAVDYQNMLLAMRLIDTSGNNVSVPIPSLHRPELVNYWVNRLGVGGWSALDPAIARKIILRPIGKDFNNPDHPSFDGGNPNFNPILGPWDVDNDGDGQPDSIWVDLGFPVQTAPDGRIYKPLFAILCEDLDGKLNLNAHGNLNQLAMGATSSVGGGPALSNPFPNVQGPYMTNAGGPAQMLIGQGYGPAEVNLNVALQFQPGEYAKLLTGDTSTHLQGRYGELNFPFSSVQYSFPAPGITDQRFEPYNSSDQIARTTMRADLSSWLKQFEYPDDHFHQNQFSEPTLSALTLSSHGAPPDLDGDGFIGLDPSGNPVYPATSAPLTTPTSTALAYLGMGETLDKWNNPYQLDLSRAAQRSFPDGSGRVYPIDAPFRPEELEVLLRGGDVDVSSLSSRLWTSYGDGLAQNTFTTNIANRIANRHRVTTESWDLPVPSLVPTADMLQSLNGMSLMSAGGLSGQQRIVGELHLANLLKVRGQRDIAKFGTAGADETKLLRHLGPEMKQGLRFDLNRPFGNGRDDNANNVVDEPEEAVAGESIWNNAFPVSGSPVTFQTGILMDHNNDGTPGGPADGLARQIYAKNLYLLLMLLIDEQFGDAAFSGMVGREKLARHVAQWAVNVADFRDRDSIMTGFEYDVLPFTDESGGDGDPWDLDDNLATDESDTVSASIKRGVVWGAERPELLITETLAVHDRRNEDTPNDPSGKKIVDPMNPDDDLDQAVPPQGSLFIEIYNPWSVEDCRYGELYDLSPLSPLVPQLHLSRTTSNGASPIWRLLVTKTADAPDKVDSGGSFDENNADRVIYFAAASTGVSDFSTNTNTNTKLVTHHGEVVNPIEPGEYLVVGPPGTTDIGTTTGGANDRKFIVAPSDPDHPFSVKDGTGTLLNPYPDPASGQPASIKRVKAASILDHQGDATPVRLSVSEPYTGYPALMATADEPFDTPNNRTDLDGADRTKIWSSGNYPAFRYVHLQRLANPLEPWNAITNPYLTIDSMPIDLTVYNSKETTATEQMAMVKPQPLDTPNFNSRQRDGGAVEPAATLHDNLWAQSSSRSNLTTGGMPLTPQDPTPVDKAVAPNHTFGYLNEAFTTSQRILANSSLNITVNGLPHNYTGLPDPQTLPPPPRGPFPHFHWPNRPFISVYELLNVPAYPSSRLLETHWFHETAATRHYTGSQFTTLAGLKDDRLQLRDIAFRHLMPWFFVQTAGTSPGGNLGPHLYRLFDFVHVSSRFAGTDTYLNPVVFQSGSHDFHPPYNKVSRYREPGKININTIFDQKGLTWQAITNRFPNLGDATFWISSVDPSRRDGLNANFPANLNLDPKSPTLFPNPFRSPSGNFLVPLDELRREGVAPGEAIRPGIDCTLLRRNPTNALVPLLANTTTTPLQVATEPTRNSYFHYQLLQKLGNILTTRSNVYAVWITVGYFEAQRVAVDASHPDGWQLGRELGTDTGEIKRHRAFFMIDRTIPVGFQRGEDLNVQDCFLIQRFIE